MSLDKADFEAINPSVTIVSIYWTNLVENKPGLIPQIFEIKAPRAGEEFSVTHLKGVIENHYKGEGKFLQIPVNPYEIGRALVEDFCSAKLEFYPPDAIPGLMVLPGKLSKEEVKAKYAAELAELKVKQLNWANRLIRKANDEWQRSGKQQRAISQDQIKAAALLGLRPEWVIEGTGKICPGCGHAVVALAPVCGFCKCILDEEKYKSLKFATA